MAYPQNTCFLPNTARPYACGTIATPQINGQNVALRSAYVNIIMVVKSASGQPKYIRVGNKSSPWYNNGAFIKNFQFGGENTAGGSFTIYDGTGNDLSTFLNALYEDSCTTNTNTILVDFGYIFQGINNKPIMHGASSFIKDSYKGWKLRDQPPPRLNKIPAQLLGGEAIPSINWLGFVVSKIEVKPTEGGWEYTVSLSTLIDKKSMRKLLSRAYGSSSGLLSLKKAANQAIKDGCGGDPSAGAVYFAKQGPDGGFNDLEFSNAEGGEEGPKNVWDPNRLPCIGAIRNWLNSLRTKDGLGVTLYTDPVIDTPNLIVMEASPDICSPPNGAYCPGKKSGPQKIYLVNAGDCSPVISFEPTVQYTVAARGQGGAAGGGTSSKMENMSGPGKNPCGNFSGAVIDTQEGIQTNAAIPASNTNFRFPTNAATEEVKGIQAQMLANIGRVQTSNIQGTLVIFGDPEYVSLSKCQGMQIGIIYFNNPGINSGSNFGPVQDNASTWLAQPPVNPVFSRTDYQVTGVSHEISDDGSYKTSLTLFAVPDQAKKNVKFRG